MSIKIGGIEIVDKRLRDILETDIKARSDKILSGSLSFEAYRAECGWIKALQWVLETADDVAKSLEGGNEDDDDGSEESS